MSRYHQSHSRSADRRHVTTRRRSVVHRLLAAVLALGFLSAVLAGCSGGDEPAGPDPSIAADSPLITIEKFEYSLTGAVEPGATIAVYNKDNVAHTVTSDIDGGFDVNIDPGETVTFSAPDEPGEYPYHCIPHPSMVSSFTVGSP